MHRQGQCCICKSTATGMHFGAFTCRACGAFFRRATVLQLQYKCKTGKEDCNVDGRGRFVCRFCRYAKCIEEGMKSEKVQLDYDPVHSIRAGVSMEDENSFSSAETSAESSRKSSEEERKYRVFYETDRDLQCTFGTPPAEDVPELCFSPILEYVLSIFRVKNENRSISDLENLTGAVKELNRGQKGIRDIKISNEHDILNVVNNVGQKIKNLSIWFTFITRFNQLEIESKMEIFKKSWKVILIFERIALTARILKERMFEEKVVLVSHDEYINLDTIQIDFSAITQCTNNYVKNMLMPFATRLVQDLGKQLVSLNLSDTEIAFSMAHLLRLSCYTMNGVTLAFCDDLEEDLANGLHRYYISENNTQYSQRLIGIMNCIRKMQGIFADGSKVLELFRLFDVFTLSIDEPSFFLL